MDIWRFSFVIDGPDLDDAGDLLDQLFEAGCGDALFGGSNGVQIAAFHRKALTIESAVCSAIIDLEQVPGLRVISLLPPDPVTIHEIATRSGHPLEEIQARMRDAGSKVPVPIDDPSAYEPVWRWCEISRWLEGTSPARDASALSFANLVSFVATRSNALRLLDALPNELRQTLSPWVASDTGRLHRETVRAPAPL